MILLSICFSFTTGRRIPTPAGNGSGSLFDLGLGLLDGHPVLYALHTVYVFDEFGSVHRHTEATAATIRATDYIPTFYPVSLLPLFHGFPVVAVSAVVGPLGIADLPPGVVV